MEKKFKRVLVLFLALVMLFGLLPAVSAPALADTEITNVVITGVTEPAVGKDPTIDGIETATAGVTINLDPNNTNWKVYLGGYLLIV